MKIIIMAALAVAAFGFNETHAQKVIKDAAGNVYIDVQNMLTGTFSNSTLNRVTLADAAGNSVYKKLQIAKDDLSKMTWAAAVGLATSYNTASAVNQTQGATSTGCRTYSTDGNTGQWRVPTQRELELMWIMKDALTTAGIRGLGGAYWSSTEFSHYQVWYLNYSNGNMNRDSDKTASLYYTRCVREVN